MTKLTEKQRQFVANKAAGCTNRDAAVSAGYAVGSASSAADKLMAMPAIRAAIKAATKGTDTKAASVTTPQMPMARYADSKSFLVDVMNHQQLPIAVRAEAAKQLLPYQHARIGETGKKESKKQAARGIARGRGVFGTKQPPQLSVVRNPEP